MVWVCLADRIKVNTAYTEAFKVIKLHRNSLEVAHKEIIVLNHSVFIGFPFGESIPILVAFEVGTLYILFFTAEIKTVGKNLIHNSADKPAGSFKAFFVAGNLPASAHIVFNGADLIRIGRNNISCFINASKLKVIPIKSDFFRGKIALPNFGILVKFTAPDKLGKFPVAVIIILYTQVCFLCMLRLRQKNSEMNLGTLFNRTKRWTIVNFSWIKRYGHIITSHNNIFRNVNFVLAVMPCYSKIKTNPPKWRKDYFIIRE